MLLQYDFRILRLGHTEDNFWSGRYDI